jgi:hypothetical protein
MYSMVQRGPASMRAWRPPPASPRYLPMYCPNQGAPAHLEDLVVVLGLDAHLLVHLPLAVLGQVFAGELHRREPQHPEDVRGVGGELDGVDVAELLHRGHGGGPASIHVGYEVGVSSRPSRWPRKLSITSEIGTRSGVPQAIAVCSRVMRSTKSGSRPGRRRLDLPCHLCQSAISAHPQTVLAALTPSWAVLQ